MSLPKVNIDEPRYDQNTYWGRAKHFFVLTNPLNLLASNAELERAKKIVQDYRAGRDVSAEVKTVDDLWRAKYLYDSAFHPETGEKSILIGRMSAQVPMNCLITGAMLSFYKATSAVIFWQWCNQTFNAVVNYTNRSGTSPITKDTLLYSYIAATGGAMATALSLNHMTKHMHPLIGRLVPFVSVAAANCINIPCMRNHELRNGVALMDHENHQVGISKKAAFVGIAAVVASRVFMAIPSMAFSPVLMNHLDKIGFTKKHPKWSAPIQTAFVGFMLIFSTPLGCALFRQQAIIKVSSLEPEVQAEIHKKNPNLTEVWFNKGL